MLETAEKKENEELEARRKEEEKAFKEYEGILFISHIMFLIQIHLNINDDDNDRLFMIQMV